ncbi:hypothetical protein M0804_009145 [Polistes exclamans]|nr:hypothetical protein M0804_009145 [Polistes exclamans]
MSSETIITGFCMFYELNYRLLLLTGLWPYQEGLELLFRVIVISICFIGGITLQSYEFYQREFSIEMIIQQFPVCILLLNTLITYCSMIFQFKLLKNISSHVAFDCNQLSNENEFNIMQKYAKTNKQITLGITRQRLLDHGTKVLESLHQVSFYEFPIKYQKAIIMLLMRSVKPCAIVINGVYVLSLNFLARIADSKFKDISLGSIDKPTNGKWLLVLVDSGKEQTTLFKVQPKPKSCLVGDEPRIICLES